MEHVVHLKDPKRRNNFRYYDCEDCRLFLRGDINVIVYDKEEHFLLFIFYFLLDYDDHCLCHSGKYVSMIRNDNLLYFPFRDASLFFKKISSSLCCCKILLYILSKILNRLFGEYLIFSKTIKLGNVLLFLFIIIYIRVNKLANNGNDEPSIKNDYDLSTNKTNHFAQYIYICT